MTKTELLIAREVRWQFFIHKLLGWTKHMTRDEYTAWRKSYASILDRTKK